jgi:tryptophanyl-tRNA synthetase
MYQFEEDDKEIIKVYNDCKTGKLLCGEHKQKAIESVLNFVKEHQRKRKKYVDKAKELLQVE